SILIDVTTEKQLDLTFNYVSEDEFNLKSSQEIQKEHSKFSLSLDFKLQEKCSSSDDLSLKGWDEAVNKLHFSETDSELLKNVKKLMKLTLPKFVLIGVSIIA
ncbi:5357_t:CDS:2, partial [Funneliformis geosporum]